MNGRQRTRERETIFYLFYSRCVCVCGYTVVAITIWEETSGSFSLNGDGDVSRYPMLMSVFHGRARLYLSLSLLSYLLFFFQWVFVSHPDEVMVRDMFLSPILMP